MNKTKERSLCWTCANLDSDRCPIKKEIKRVSKFNGVETAITDCRKYKQIT